MSNRSLFIFLAFIVAGFVVWGALDLQKTQDAVQHDGLKRDVISGSSGVFGATAQYDFTFPTPTLRHDRSTSEIGQIISTGPAENTKIPGLTDVKFHLETTYRFHVSRRWLKGGYEMWVSNLVVHFGFTDITVYLSDEYKEGSCQYLAVQAHENEHVEAHRHAWMDYQPILREAIRNAQGIPTEVSHGVFTTEAEGKEKIEKEISAVTDPVFEAFQKTDEQAQMAIDSRSSYEGVKAKCANW